MNEMPKKVILDLNGLILVLGFVLVIPVAVYAQTEGEQEEGNTPPETPVAEPDSGEVLVADGDVSRELEELIVVTGSRIPRSNLTTAVPVTLIDREFLENSGEVFLADILSQIPQLTPSSSQVNFGSFDAGLGTVDLRGFGSGRTLTLVNGRRHVGGVLLSPIVDVNTIPQDFIERVELLTGGASAVYGADALAGVTNFVLRDTFEGVRVRSQYGISERGDAQTWFISASVGSNFNSDRGNAAFNIEYTRRSRLDKADRVFTSRQQTFIENPDDMDTADFDDGVPDNILIDDAGLSIITPGGVVFVGDPSFQSTFNADGTFRPFDFGSTDPAMAVMTGLQVGGDRLRLAGRGPLLPFQQRIMATSILSYDLADWARFYSEAKLVFTDNSGSERGQPPFDNGFGDLIIRRDNAFIPTGLGLLMDRSGLLATEMRRFHDEFVERSTDVFRLTLRTALGVKGEVSENLSYDIGMTWGRTELSADFTQNLIQDSFIASTDAVVDLDGEVNGNPGEIVCRVNLQQVRGQELTLPNGDRTAAFVADGCVPTSVFGPGAINQGARDYAARRTTTGGSLEQVQVMGFAALNSTNYFELPGGPISLVIGSEYRRDQASERNDVAVGLDVLRIAALVPSRGAVDVGELFGELSLPLLSGLTGIEELTVSAGGRLSRYNLDQVGTILTSSVTGLYRPTVDLAVRGSYSRAVRAPNIQEAFAGRRASFFDLNDPCDEDSVFDADSRRVENCTALAEQVGFEGYAPGRTNIEDASSREGFVGGNPELDSEKSSNWTAGGVVTPRWIPGLTLTGDYYNFTVNDQISLPPADDVVRNCVDLDSIENNRFCDIIERSPESFEIESIELRSLNLVSLETEGIDLQAQYTFDVARMVRFLGGSGLTDLGLFNLRMNANHVIRFRDFPDQNDRDDQRVLEGFRDVPEWRVSALLNYYVEDLGFTYRFNWVDGFSRAAELELFEADPDAQEPMGVRPRGYHNMRLSYQLLEQLQIYGGVNNISDQKPPRDFDGSNGFYDILGRFYYFGTQIDL